MGKTIREGLDLNGEALKNQGPGHYDPKHPADIQKKPIRATKSQGANRGKLEGFKAGTNFFQKQKQESVVKMEDKIRKQPKWHQLVSSVPSIPPKDKQVPEGDDYEAEPPSPSR